MVGFGTIRPGSMKSSSTRGPIPHPSKIAWVFKTRCKAKYRLRIYSNCAKLVCHLQVVAISFFLELDLKQYDMVLV